MSEAAHPAATPAPGRLLALTDQCVQCGLCLPTCPTYRFEALETESPRGRIALARAWELATVPPTPTGDTHLDHCLGCRRCEVVCPAGVEYGPLLVAARSRQRERRPAGWKQRGAEWLCARPGMLTRLLGLYRRLYPLLPTAWRPLPQPPAPARLPLSQSADVALFLGCVARPYETSLQAAMLRLGAAVDVAIAMPDRQTCCGSLHAHAGNTATANALAAANRASFVNASTVLTLASGCHEALAQALPTPTLDALDFFAQRGDGLRFRSTRERIALHLPCTQRNVVKSDIATRALLARVPGLEIIELDGGFGCCGAAGTQMLTEPARAAAYRQPLLDQFAATGATRLLSANIGCRLHFANGTQALVQHPLEFLAECLDS
ncbi:(Fe-S)-binding protein [Lysobacter sp. CFH 32150]|uniref:(Fe-S)-binding protein n=1 Tax=Lysobacter sp. CFH 32150 TaxID=2927128 RepID=UPI001FA6AAC8|nr:(Fe-S)-binding protein [Lysobacter sp. CFH 32150]MCI4567614.1 (Fe-S)-binding protein [Lysobacter sp. CFH 32150]